MMWEGEGEGEGGSTGGLPATDTQKCILPFPLQVSQGSYDSQVPSPLCDVQGQTLSSPLLYIRHWHGLIYLITTTQ